MLMAGKRGAPPAGPGDEEGSDGDTGPGAAGRKAFTPGRACCRAASPSPSAGDREGSGGVCGDGRAAAAGAKVR